MACYDCSYTCSGGCYTACTSTCSGGCTGTCSSACSENCTGSCTGGCYTTCSGTCSGSCTGGCTGTCSSACSENCTGSCTGGCYTTCSGTCSGSCTGGCTGTCSNACGAACTSTCSGGCTGTCSNSCGAVCTSTCSGGCTGTCSNSCGAVCTSTCSGSCSEGCSGSCTGTCASVCAEDCTGACVHSCLSTNQFDVPPESSILYQAATISSDASITKLDGTSGTIDSDEVLRVLAIQNETGRAIVEYHTGGAYKNTIDRAILNIVDHPLSLVALPEGDIAKNKLYFNSSVTPEIGNVTCSFMFYDPLYKLYDLFANEDSYRYFEKNEYNPISKMQQVIDFGQKLYLNSNFKITSYFGEFYGPKSANGTLDWNNVDPLANGEYINLTTNRFNGIHKGTDFAMALNTPFYSVTDGQLIVRQEYGFHIIVIYVNDIVNNRKYLVDYQHANAYNTSQKLFDTISEGDNLGTQGTYGTPDTHVHVGFIPVSDSDALIIEGVINTQEGLIGISDDVKSQTVENKLKELGLFDNKNQTSSSPLENLYEYI